MKTLLLNEASFTTGVGVYAKLTYEALSKYYEVNLLNFKFYQHYFELGQTVDRNYLKDHNHLNMLISATIGKVRTKKEKYDVVHALNSLVSIFSDPQPDFVTLHHLNSFENPKNYNYSFRIAAKFVVSNIVKKSKIITLSHYEEKILKKHFPCAKVKVIYPYSQFSRFAEVKDKIQARQNLRIPYDAKVIIAVGVGLPYKNFKTLYKAVNNKNYYIIRVGDSKFREEETLNMKIPANVHYFGSGNLHLNTLLDAYLSSDLLVFTSVDEGFGIPLMEAFSLGLPVVANHCTSVPELVGNAGILVNDPFNPDELFEAINEAYFNSDKYSKKSKDRSGLFTEESFLKNLVDAYSAKYD